MHHLIWMHLGDRWKSLEANGDRAALVRLDERVYYRNDIQLAAIDCVRYTANNEGLVYITGSSIHCVGLVLQDLIYISSLVYIANFAL